MDIKEIPGKFAIDSEPQPYGDGHINETYLLESQRYILQRINTSIFTDPAALMENVARVTAFLREKIRRAGGDPLRETLTVIPTKDGKSYYAAPDGSAYRMYLFVPNTVSVSQVTDPHDLLQVGRGFGRFQRMLGDYPADTLHEVIPDFHHTPKRIEALRAAIAADAVGRVASVRPELDFALGLAGESDRIVRGIEDGSIPLRVTHNDTKINNILFDAATREAICVIDLDTVMPGSVLYDIGDALRTGAADAAEDEADLSLVHFNMDAFTYFVRGFLDEMRGEMTARETELIPYSAMLMTYECGVRFLTDYLCGDTYFRIHRPDHNLIRARNQFAMVRDILQKTPEMREIVAHL